MGCTPLKNLAQAPCPWLSRNFSAFLIVPKYKQDGTVNEFATISAFTKADIIAKLDAADIDDRIFYLKNFKNYTDEKADSIVEAFGDGTEIEVEEGQRNVTLWLPQEHALLKGKLDAWKGREFGVYLIDKAGNLIYSTDVTTGLKVVPIPVDGKSLRTKWINAGDAVTAKIEIKFNFDQTFNDSLLRYTLASSLDFNGNQDFYSLFDVSVTLASTANDVITAVLATEYSTPVKGLILTDFVLTNLTNPGVLNADSVTENPDGTYTFDLSTEETGSNVDANDNVTVAITKAKYDFGAIETVVMGPATT